ncbi:N-acetyl-gamma-glutamyl-phosphate reductase [Acuticoccus yangtzensis]|uniref:N-acetyl-gamma-glutamyl-phosphate reductase n=1 Tax=Acuticoccus yangtzensis TaxID=1443441 RepID=UPI00094959F5|nr:N-acetyl-gamma-glutamyl-phosphate reductase [Acuticoccus yangtzensis]ORE92125.1 N-acetyl-gamma-glutamyl-phosphate reductase [Stappia sp. 22II-S9-Z10]
MTLNVAIYGASGYTGAELLRLLLVHPEAKITALSAESNAGKAMASVFPQLAAYDLPTLTTIADLDLAPVDVLFCALPHGTTQTALKAALEAKPDLKIVDLSADFRLSDPAAYAHWYGHAHQAEALQKEAVYGLTEIHRDAIAKARLVGNPGCYTTTSLLALVPLVGAGVVETDNIVIDAKSGVTGAGRAAKVATLFSEVAEGFHAYSVGNHRHTAELDQELSLAAGAAVEPTFTPHLIPINRAIYATIYVSGDPKAIHDTLAAAYADEFFVNVLPFGEVPQSRHVRGTNFTRIGVVPDRRKGRAIVISTLDNLVKGASGQAVQNMNVMCGLPEATGLKQLALFP